jgi:hypothetical protein
MAADVLREVRKFMILRGEIPNRVLNAGTLHQGEMLKLTKQRRGGQAVVGLSPKRAAGLKGGVLNGSGCKATLDSERCSPVFRAD